MLRPRTVTMRAEAELEEIDPMTGQVISKSLAMVASETVKTASGVTWAYRSTGKDSAGTPVVFIHGLGSNSFTWRFVLQALAEKGFSCVAPDWVGHGGSDKPDLAYTQSDFAAGLAEFLEAVGLGGDAKISLVVQGYVLPQYAMLWAAANEDRVERIVVLPTPLSLKTKLPPALAPYKAAVAFLRPKKGEAFAGDVWAASQSAYVMQREVADGYQAPFDADPMASTCVERTMEALDWKALLGDVDEAFRTWKTPGLVATSTSDPFLKTNEAFEWLDSKRTCLRGQAIDAKVGHIAQEDYPQPVADLLAAFLSGGMD